MTRNVLPSSEQITNPKRQGRISKCLWSSFANVQSKGHEHALELWDIAGEAMHRNPLAWQRIRDLGRELNRTGGFDAMRMHYLVLKLFTEDNLGYRIHTESGRVLKGAFDRMIAESRGFYGYPAMIEYLWHGIGEWQN